MIDLEVRVGDGLSAAALLMHREEQTEQFGLGGPGRAQFIVVVQSAFGAVQHLHIVQVRIAPVLTGLLGLAICYVPSKL